MELLAGETLGPRLSAGALPVRKAIEYGSQIARGLATAHEVSVDCRERPGVPVGRRAATTRSARTLLP